MPQKSPKIGVRVEGPAAPVLPPATPAPILTEEPVIPVTGLAKVQSIEIQILESNPLQVNAILRGQLPDSGCTTISSVDQVREENTFRLNVSTTTTNDPAVSCAQVLTPFEQVVALDVRSLPPGNYIVKVNGLEQSFDLPVRDASQFGQVLVDRLNARDYAKLESLMEPTFMIAYWQSEGTSNTPEQAIEQLQRSLLNQASPIVADPNKDLAALLGMDPVTVVGPNAVDVSPLHTSGWGAEGKDEAILFIAKRPSGDYYWYGLLLAKEGFAKPAPVVTQPPVDTRVYNTQVKYVTALKDVNIHIGPGAQFTVVGMVAAGETVQVLGVNAEQSWWQVPCLADEVNCWVLADPGLTQPTSAPGS